MKKTLLTLGIAAFGAFRLSAQCLTIACPPAVNTTTSGSCGAVVNFNAPVVNTTCVGTVSDTFFYSGAMQTYVVPAGVTSVTIETWGAQGGANWVNNVNYGGYTKADFAVTPGETLYIYVGQQPNGITGGFNGGGNGEGAGQGGGGATDVRQGGTTLNDRIIVAGGAGGAGYWSALHVVGGLGGGLTGGNGYRDPDYATNPGGEGGTQSSSGNGTCVSFNNPSVTGGFGYGGAPSGCGCEGYGGGGGWYGGAGSGNCRGGGGGSSYVLPAATNVTMQQGGHVGNGLAVISYNGAATATYSQTAGLPSGSIFPVGTTTNTFTASDAFGNTATCSFDVVVVDNELPVIASMPGNISVNNDSGSCGAVVTWTAPSITDNCSVTATSNYNSGDQFPVGTTTVTYAAVDPSGNTASASFDITVTDNEAPAMICAANITVTADPGQCSASSVAIGTSAATDNCGIAALTNDAPATFPLGATTVTWTAIDVHGNPATCTQTVTVVDNEAPQFLDCPASMSMCPDVLMFNTPSAMDNCSGTSVNQILGPASGSSLTAGNYTISFVATDASGNTDTCSFTVTVHPNPVVTLNLTMPATVCAADANYTLSGESPAGGSWNGNGVTGSTFDPSAAGNGIQSIMYYYTDTNGCVGSAFDTVTVSPCVGIDEKGATAFELFPNPASGSFWFSSDKNGTLELLNVNGQVVLTQTITASRQEINVANVAEGVYVARFTTNNGVSNGRLVIRR